LRTSPESSLSYLTSKYILKSLARRSNLVTRNLRLKIEAQLEKIYLIKNIPSFKPYLYQICNL